jgi:hypothetical protein
VSFLREGQQEFKLIDQEEPSSRIFRPTNNTGAAAAIRQKAASDFHSLHFDIIRFDIQIDRVSVSQHGTALLILEQFQIISES